MIFHLGVHLLVDDVVPRLLPVPVPHGLAGRNHVLTHALRGPHLVLLIMLNIKMKSNLKKGRHV